MQPAVYKSKKYNIIIRLSLCSDVGIAASMTVGTLVPDIWDITFGTVRWDAYPPRPSSLYQCKTHLSITSHHDIALQWWTAQTFTCLLKCWRKIRETGLLHSVCASEQHRLHDRIPECYALSRTATRHLLCHYKHQRFNVTRSPQLL